MHNRKQVVWFGMFLGVFLLGCPPAAKTAKDSKQEAAQESSGDAQQPGDAQQNEDEKSSGTPAPSGGW